MNINELVEIISERIKHYNDSADSNSKDNRVHSHWAYCIGAKDALFELYSRIIGLNVSPELEKAAKEYVNKAHKRLEDEGLPLPETEIFIAGALYQRSKKIDL